MPTIHPAMLARNLPCPPFGTWGLLVPLMTTNPTLASPPNWHQMARRSPGGHEPEPNPFDGQTK